MPLLVPAKSMPPLTAKDSTVVPAPNPELTAVHETPSSVERNTVPLLAPAKTVLPLTSRKIMDVFVNLIFEGIQELPLSVERKIPVLVSANRVLPLAARPRIFVNPKFTAVHDDVPLLVERKTPFEVIINRLSPLARIREEKGRFNVKYRVVVKSIRSPVLTTGVHDAPLSVERRIPPGKVSAKMFVPDTAKLTTEGPSGPLVCSQTISGCICAWLFIGRQHQSHTMESMAQTVRLTRREKEGDKRIVLKGKRR